MKNDILNLFLFENKLKFSEIEKKLNKRSNKLAYHLKKLVGRGVLDKVNDYYKLSDSAESLIPYISDKQSVLPVVLIHIGDNNRALLYQRSKRPYKDKLGMPCGRIVVGESISGAVKRIMLDKFKINAKFKRVNSISLEHVKKNKNIVHSFLLIFVSAYVNADVLLTKIKTNQRKIIASDYMLLTQNKLNEIKINQFNINEK